MEKRSRKIRKEKCKQQPHAANAAAMNAGRPPAIITKREMTRPNLGTKRAPGKFRKRQRSLSHESEETASAETLKRGTKVHALGSAILAEKKCTWEAALRKVPASPLIVSDCSTEEETSLLLERDITRGLVGVQTTPRSKTPLVTRVDLFSFFEPPI